MNIDEIGIREQRSLYKLYRKLNTKPKGEKSKTGIVGSKLKLGSTSIDLVSESGDVPFTKSPGYPLYLLLSKRMPLLSLTRLKKHRQFFL